MISHRTGRPDLSAAHSSTLHYSTKRRSNLISDFLSDLTSRYDRYTLKQQQTLLRHYPGLPQWCSPLVQQVPMKNSLEIYKILPTGIPVVVQKPKG